MRIGIDAALAGSAGTGTATYTRGLVTALVNAAPAEQFILYFQPRDVATNPLWTLDAPHVQREVVDGRGQAGRSLWSLARAAQRSRLDIFHSTAYFLPLWKGRKVVTFHDANVILQWRRRWGAGTRLRTLSLATQTALSARLASSVLADSQHAAVDVQRVFRLPGERVRVVYPGIDQRFFRPDPSCAADIRSQWDLGQYAIFVGELTPQKNVTSLIRAVSRLDHSNLQLALVGRDVAGHFKRDLLPLIEKLGLRHRVRRLGVVHDAALPSLLAGAAVAVFPSYAEGFGLPPLEAMAAGVPVVASNASCFPEVLGTAAMLVDPYSVEALAEAIHTSLDPTLRQDRKARGRAWAGRYTWERAADLTLQVYRQAIEGQP